MALTSTTSLTQRILIGPAAPEVLFFVLTDPEITPAFFNRCAFKCERLEAGAPYSLVAGETLIADGTILVHEAPNIELTFAQHWDDEIKDTPGRVRLTVNERSPLCELEIVHDGLTPGSRLNDELDDFWLTVASGLKTLAETDRTLPFSQEEAKAIEATGLAPAAR